MVDKLVEVTQADRDLRDKFIALDWPGNHAVYEHDLDQMIARHRLAATPTEDARERVKVLEEARKSAKALRDAAARSVKSGHRQAHLNLEMMAVALDKIDTVLGNKETDRHG